MKELIANIIRWIKQNKTLATLIAAVVTLVLIFIYNLISGAIEPTVTTLIDLPLPINSELEITVPKSTYEDLDLKNRPTMDVFYAQETDYSSTIDVFLARIGKTNLPKTQYEELLTIWTNDEDLFQYSQIKAEVFFRFSDPVAIPDVEFGFYNNDNGDEALAEVARALTGNVYSYTNIKVKETGSEFRIEGNREVGGTRIERPGIAEYSDYLVIQDDGKIVEGRFFIAEISDTSLRSKIIHPTNLQAIISEEIYPKEISQGYARSITQEDYQVSSAVEESSFGDITLESLSFPQVTEMATESMEIVYFWDNYNYPEIFPVYKIEGTGEVTFNGKEYVVPMYVYASALDPAIVYIPADLDEPTPDL